MKKRHPFRIILSTILALILAAAGVIGYKYWEAQQNLRKNSVDITPTKKPDPKPEKPSIDAFEGAFTMLIAGSDDGNGNTAKYGEGRDHSLNDVTMLIHVTEDHKNATAISFPRDMLVNIPECHNQETGETILARPGEKLNQALNGGGLGCVVATVSQLTGQEIPHAAMIQFDGVIALSNAVGGVPVCVSEPINDPKAGLNIPAGEVTLQGDDALAFLRTRYGVGDGSDLSRISNQQLFLSSLMRELKSKETLTDVNKVLAIADVASKNMTLSTSLADIPTLASLAYMLKDLPLEDITFVQYPTVYSDDLTMLYVNAAPAEALIQAVFSGAGIQLTDKPLPDAPEAPVSDETSESGEADAPAEVTPPGTEEGLPHKTEVPSEVTGQKASEVTCSAQYVG